MTQVITYGTYDLLRQGRINLLRRAKELGDHLIDGVTSDSFDRVGLVTMLAFFNGPMGDVCSVMPDFRIMVSRLFWI